MVEIRNSGKFRWSYDVAQGPHSTAWSSGRLVKPQVRHGVATIHNMEMFVLCFVFLFRYSKGLSIGLMRTL